MTSNDESPKVPANSDAPAPDEAPAAEVTPAEVPPLDPKELARQRSKADLQRKRRNLRGSRGKL